MDNHYRLNKKRNKQNKLKNSKMKNFIHNYFIDFISRFMICVAITLLGLIAIKKSSDLKNKIQKYVYEDNFNFSYFNQLYTKYLGGVFPLDSFIKTEKVFNEKLNYVEEEKYRDGCKLKVEANYLVPSIESGIVVYIGDKDYYGSVVIVQQNNGVDVWYGNVTSSLDMYDYVEKGELLGEAKDNSLYLVFEKEGKFLDYKDYI